METESGREGHEMSRDWKEKLQGIISWEIAIEYKACLYFSCIVFFYSAYLFLQKTYAASILVIWEMILTAYAVGYLQVYLFRNFDEAQQLGKKEFLGIALCACLYAGTSWGLGWFDKKGAATLLFVLYMVLCYLCVFLCNKIKRGIDTKRLNQMLEAYKKGEEHG